MTAPTRTRRWLVGLAWSYLAATLLVALALGAFLLWGLPELLPPGSAITIDGERIEIGAIHLQHAGHWLLFGMSVFAVAAVLTLVLPLLVALSILVPLATGALGLAVSLGMLAAVLSPVILLVWWFGRSRGTIAR